MKFALSFFLALCSAPLCAQSIYYVSTTGVDTPSGGSTGAPWASITYALDRVPDNSIILVRAGTYTGQIRIRGNFAQGVTVKSETPYLARLRHNGTVLTTYNEAADIRGITIEGFDISHSGPGSGALVVQIQDSLGTDTHHLTLRNNILHDSYNNDILKINNGASDIVVSGNVFYNQFGTDQHMDINSVQRVTVQDNIFFNDFAASGRSDPSDTHSFLLVKDSNGTDDEHLGSSSVTIKRNIFMNWQGSNGNNFLQLGDDGQPFPEAFDILVENNLMLGNSASTMRAAFGCAGCGNTVFRANTIHGNLPSYAYAMRLYRLNPLVKPSNMQFYNNIWSDPSGSMDDFSDADPSDLDTFVLLHNMYWNGGNPIPSDASEAVNIGDDLQAYVANPNLPNPAGAAAPYWNAGAGNFNGGFASIRDAFVSLVNSYGKPSSGTALIGRGTALFMPSDDILGNPRDSAPDIGAFEAVAAEVVFANGFE